MIRIEKNVSCNKVFTFVCSFMKDMFTRIYIFLKNNISLLMSVQNKNHWKIRNFVTLSL